MIDIGRAARLYAWVIMRWLKGRTGRAANRIPGRTGIPFWQDESYDHWIRSGKELKEI